MGEPGGGGATSGPAADRARTTLVNARDASQRVARRALGVDAGTDADALDGRVRHLELAIETADVRIAGLEVLCHHLLDAVDHQGTRLEALQEECARLRSEGAQQPGGPSAPESS